ncbi:MAG: Fic family protein [Paludibacteraceae bacterium]|nr:Fic family protein [Paludibacteraceae bacterium]
MKEFPPYQPDFEEYIRQGEPDKKARAQIWRTAIGLQQVDGLQTSEYLREVAKRNIEGDITLKKAKTLIDSYYQSEQVRHDAETEDTQEADKVSQHIAELLSEKAFTFSPTQLIAIHRHLFQGIYKFAGKIRNYNITKKEWVLRGDTIYYASADMIYETLQYDFTQEKEFDYSSIEIIGAIKHITHFCSNLWQIHPFGEGNTRTTAVFMIKYLRSLGFDVNNDLFAENSWYFRNALVRANYRNVLQGIDYTPSFLERFFRNLLLGEHNVLLNREMHLDWKETTDDIIQSAIQSANNDNLLSPKCKNCTLEELAVLRVIQQNPSATQKKIAQNIGKSERTVKTLTIRLSEKEIIVRRNGKRNGYWEIL